MTSKQPDRFGRAMANPTCRRKVRYRNRNVARDAAIKSSKRDGTVIEPYKCSCGGWHIGHPPHASKRRRRKR